MSDDAAVPETGDVLISREGRVATVTFNRPSRLNALTPEMRAELWGILDRLDQDPDVRAIVLTGAGGAFCAGSDRGRLATYSSEEVQQRFDTQQRSPEMMLHLGTPIVAAVDGAAAGLGFAIAMLADVRFTTPTAKWTTSFARLGLTAEAGLSWLLPRIVGFGRASDLLLSARVLSGQEAYDLGLAEFLCEPAELLAGAKGYAANLAHNSPHSLRTIRRQLRDDATAPLDETMERMRRLVVESIAGPDFGEAQRAMSEGREPRF